MATTDRDTRKQHVPRRRPVTDHDQPTEEIGPSPGVSPEPLAGQTEELEAGDVQEILAGAQDLGWAGPGAIAAGQEAKSFVNHATDLRTRRGVLTSEAERNVYYDLNLNPRETALDNQATPRETPGEPDYLDNSQGGIDGLDALVARKVAEMFAAVGATGTSGLEQLARAQPGGNPVFSMPEKEEAPSRYLAHFRDDVSPNREVQEMNMDVIDSGGSRAAAVMRGSVMQFRRGHFFATTDNQVRHLRWAMELPTHDPVQPEKVIGGLPTVYEDDGDEIMRCPVANCGEPFAKYESLTRHMRASHGVTV